MIRVWKYVISPMNDVPDISTPEGAKLVHVGLHGKQIGLWFEVNPAEKHSIIRSFRVYGTGHPIEMGSHVGTVIMIPFVWHVYEL